MSADTPAPAALDTIPEALREDVARHWERYVAAAEQAGVALPDGRVAETLPRVWATSEFVASACARDARLLDDLVASGDLERAYGDGDYAQRVQAALDGVADQRDLAARLRRVRRREMVRVAWRDLAGWADLDEVLRDLSAFAETMLEAALGQLDAWLAAEWGAPVDEAGERQGLVVLGLGKLGGGELNFSSDIDLIFAYPEPGETQAGRSNEEYFTRLGQRLLAVIGEPTSDGFVFRTDMRLRPNGDSGPLVASFDAIEAYYQAQGREWERYALIKARPVAGDRAAGERLMELLRPFVYRRYLDFGAYASLREMKAMIVQQVARKGRGQNIKTGAGGIREVEFIGQAFQLVRGGREPALRHRGILTVLPRLAEHGYLPDYVARSLTEAYRFFRRLENRLQERGDQQTHTLPDEPVECTRLAFAMDYGDWESLSSEITRNRDLVHGHFQQVVAAPQAETGGEAQGPDLAAVWRGTLEDEPARAALEQAGFDDPGEALRLVTQLHAGHTYRALGGRGRERMDQLMPLLLGAVAQTERPEATLLRVTNLIETIARRAAYLSLLVENPMALSQLVRLCAASPWIADFVRQHPLTLDELLDPRTLYAPLDRAGLERELDEALRRVTAGDLEAEMEALRRFKQVNTLRVAAADIVEAIPLMVVSDHLTELAEVIVQRVWRLAHQHLAERHGRPRCSEVDEARFAVVGYGKLGGIELGYGSDLDLVFLYDCPGEEQGTDGDKAVENAEFFARLGQRIIHILSARMPTGVLYEVDTRLRPSGHAGLLVSTAEAFADYQREQAWTWEHQALVRARVVAGDDALSESFQAIRREILTRPRQPEELRAQVRDMRARMRRELGSKRRGVFDLKQDRGGITDIEFIAQYGVLAWAHDHPELVRYTDNIRILDGFAAEGLMPADDVRALQDAYRAYRARLHRLTLQRAPAQVAAQIDEGEFAAERATVTALWDRLLED